MKPRVSVVMSVHNAEKWVSEAIKSVLCQTHKDFEFIIGDDASTDRTREIINAFQDDRIHPVVFSKRLTLTRALNTLLSYAQGAYIARMDGDDRAYSNRLKKQVQFLDKHADVGLIGSWFHVINESSNLIRSVQVPSTDSEIRKVVMRYNPICHSTMMFRKSLTDSIGMYDVDLNGAEDYDLVLRALTVTRLANLPMYLLDYRIVDTSVSVAHMDRVLRQSQRARMKALRHYNYPKHLAIHLVIPSITSLVPHTIKVTIRKWLGYL